MDKFAKRKELVAQLDSLNREIFSDGCKDLFISIPEVSSFSWNQYTPYFNDGDECVFRVNTEPRSVTINGITINVEDGWPHVYEVEYGKNPEGKTWEEKNPAKSQEQIEKEAIESIFDDSDGEEHKFTELGISYARYQAILNASKFLWGQDEDTMKDTFGDHVEVTLNSDGTSSDEGYEHD